jgi:hypothetical protein
MSFCDTSIEFDIYESMRRKLARVLAANVRDEITAERAALYVMQGLLDVPRLLNALASDETSEEETRAILDAVLGNVASLERARSLLASAGLARAND